MKNFKCPNCKKESNSVYAITPALGYGSYYLNHDGDDIDYEHQEFEYDDEEKPIEFSCRYCDHVLPNVTTEEELKAYWEAQE